MHSDLSIDELDFPVFGDFIVELLAERAFGVEHGLQGGNRKGESRGLGEFLDQRVCLHTINLWGGGAEGQGFGPRLRGGDDNAAESQSDGGIERGDLQFFREVLESMTNSFLSMNSGTPE